MRRILALVPWAVCALAVVSLDIFDADSARVGVREAAAQAKPKKAQVSKCVTFSQAESGEDSIAMTLTSKCDVDLSCSVSWSIRCDADDAQRKEREVFVLLGNTHYTADASADVCGDDGWAIDDVEWTCKVE